MKAIIATGYGSADVLRLSEMTRPVPGDDEVLVRVLATPVTQADVMMRRGTPFYARLFLGLTKPKNPVPGTGFSGIVEGIGKKVTGFKAGDAVFGETGMHFGAYAAFAKVKADHVILRLPEGVTHEEAATLCDGPLTAASFLKDLAKIKPGQHVLINGASGSIGTAAVQLAKAWGASVTGVCSASNADMVKSLGADHVIDYAREDFTQHEARYDVIFDTIGKSSFRQCEGALTAKGQYICPVLTMRLLLQMKLTERGKGKKALFSPTGLREAKELRPLLEDILSLMKDGKLKVMIDRRYDLDDVPRAHAYVEKGHKRGNVVAILNPDKA